MAGHAFFVHHVYASKICVVGRLCQEVTHMSCDKSDVSLHYLSKAVGCITRSLYMKDLTGFEVLMVNHTGCSSSTTIGLKQPLDEIGNEMAE